MNQHLGYKNQGLHAGKHRNIEDLESRQRLVRMGPNSIMANASSHVQKDTREKATSVVKSVQTTSEIMDCTVANHSQRVDQRHRKMNVMDATRRGRESCGTTSVKKATIK